MNLSELNKHLELIQKLHKAQELYQNISAKTLGATKLDGMPHGSGVGDKVGMLAIELADLEARINYLKFEVQKNSVGVEAFINNIDDDLTRMIFRLRYLHGYSWREISSFIGGKNTEEAVKMICYRYLNS
ncbi:MAG: hypothetical protein J6B49_00970 [Phascolarctobacterium sp.]|nr:hypothetical protein [Phascolarctobacterium sp.]